MQEIQNYKVLFKNKIGCPILDTQTYIHSYVQTLKFANYYFK